MLLKTRSQQWLQHLTLSDNPLGLALLALLAGIAAALVITLFRLAIAWPLEIFLPMASEDDYEALSAITRVALLLGGGLLLILLFQPLSPAQRSVGVTHVLMRMERHQGYMPAANLVLQWLAAAIALLSGHSVGREGPAIHMGAGTASQLGQAAGVAHHRLRILAGAGVASAIAASFNTPMAGVIFAMEVVLLEYNLRGFIPIILASVAGAVISQVVFGSATAFDVPPLAMHSLIELPYVVALGLTCGLLATGFITLTQRFQALAPSPLWVRWGGLTLTTAAIAWWLPGILGIGYDTVNAALAGNVAIGLCLGLLAGKLVLAAWASAVGFPAGLIGPTMFMGALAGGILGKLSLFWMPDYPVEIGFYVMLGMGAMMGAVLRAPLAALIALLELTANPHIIMPGMLAIVIATLVAGEVFRLPSIFQVQLGNNNNGLYQPPHPVQMMLRSTWVAEALSRSLAISARHISLQAARHLIDQQTDWLYIEDEQTILPPAELAEFIDSQESSIAEESSLPADIDLLGIPAERFSVGRIALKANLQDALDHMQTHDLHWLAVYRRDPDSRKGPGPCVGLVSRAMIERHYRYRPQIIR
ncbi:chloride channel protein [Oceanobacter sp. 5_MG-2023]|uniref:chloride channel protein n=1 Tax=Oceanobacter sp. 5_MG-2023 TaxID=3062645 RepID=UPI0026E1469E|nr:chloride channel protein [Oceanobacter sp. 5_MG-2023]MDO6680969.1 chloride channel protein [Oceanobacter sp. 5_MG-2023]